MCLQSSAVSRESQDPVVHLRYGRDFPDFCR
jgi:hypothetical protein